MLLGVLRIVGKSVFDHQSAMVDAKAHAVAGQNKRLMGVPSTPQRAGVWRQAR